MNLGDDCVTVQCHYNQVKGSYFTLAHHRLSGQSVRLNPGGSEVQIPSGTLISVDAISNIQYSLDYSLWRIFDFTI